MLKYDPKYVNHFSRWKRMDYNALTVTDEL